MTTTTRWLQPRTLSEAIGLLANPGATPVAGGVEVMLGLQQSRAVGAELVALAGIGELDKFLAHPKIGLHIGAIVRLRSVESDVWVAKRWAALHEAVEQISPPQIHNMGTVVGNLCAGNGLYDLPVALAAHRASLIVAASSGMREVAVVDFYDADGKPRLGRGELVTAVVAPKPSPDAGSAFRKISKPPRSAGDVSKLSAAVYVALNTSDDTVKQVAVAIGGTAPVRLSEVEAQLVGQPAATASFSSAGLLAAEQLASTGVPWVDKVNARWLSVLVRDALEQAASRARSRHDPFDDASAMIEASQ